MRLTLRTLLAYMDGLLDAKDSQEIGKKIEDSESATELFHKIRDVMRRLRLGAPSITERGTNVDCNTVAEYLDNALPSDRVPDFEMASLKSEMHLAELASCHQILTMVLGEPVDIDPESRQRMYQLPAVANRVDEERLAAVEAANVLSGDGNAAPASAPPKVRPRPVVPEYLRSPKKSRLLPNAAVMLLVGAAIGLLLLMFGQFNPGTPLGNALHWIQVKVQGKSEEELAQEEAEHAKSAKPASGEAARPSAETVAGSGDAAAGKGGKSSAAANSSDAKAFTKDSGNLLAAGKGEIPVPIAEKPAVEPIAGKSARADGSPLTARADGSPLTASSNGPAAAAGPLPSGSAAMAVAGAELKGPELKAPPTPAAADSAHARGPVEVARATGPKAANSAELRPEGVPGSPPPSAEDKAKIGRFMSDGQDVFLRFEAKRGGWRRVLPEEFLAADEPLLALPSYRSRVAIMNVGATLELINGTRIELLSDKPQGPPGVDINFGRVILKPLAQAGARLRVVAGSHTGTITLTSLESVAALEVTRIHDPGKDPEKGISSHAVTKIYVAVGGAVWEEGDGKQLALTAPAELVLDGPKADTPPDAAKEIPKWITTNTINELDQRTGLSVSQALVGDRAASLGLMELTEDRRKEVCGLAARCLGYLGTFDPMTAALNDLEYRAKWPEYIDQLKEAIARGPETAAGVRQSLEKQYGNDSKALYRMLWGYTDKQLEGGEDAQLVKYLEHESPIFRVLAIENLTAITAKTLGYRPEVSAAKRNQALQLWRRQLQLGWIRFNQPELKPRGAPAELPSKESVPPPPKKLDESLPGDVAPASAVEPLDPGVAPDTSAKRPRVAVPEPQP